MNTAPSTRQPLQNAPYLHPYTAPFAAANALFGSNKNHTANQSGVDPNSLTPTNLGVPGQVAYDANKAGSFEGNYNQILNSFDPTQLLQRYSANLDPSHFNTALDQANAAAYKSFVSIVGRPPSEGEFSEILPIFQQPNGKALGNSYLSQFAEKERQNPNSVYATGKAGQYKDQLSQQFQSMLGRDPTQDELNHFGSLLATGNVDQYQINDFLRGTPEYQTTQDTQFRQGLDKQLQDSDVNFFNRASQGVQSQFMQNGTGQSSALTSALTDLMGQISQQRSQYLAGLSAQQYGGNKDLALSNYGNTQNQFLQNQNYNRSNALNQQNYLQGRSDNLADYQTQMRDYMNMNQGGRGGNGFANILGGALAGGGAFAATRNPYAIAGGAAAGGAYGYLNGRNY